MLVVVTAGLLIVGTSAQCASIGGVYAMIPMQAPRIPPRLLENQNIDGLSLMGQWVQIEPSEGQWNWQSVDEMIALARKYHKKVSLGVLPGIFTPDWVYADGAASFSFRWDRPFGPPPCSQVRLPLPWDPVYMAKWESFIRALGARYGGNPNVVMVRLTGVNAQTPELALPASRPGEKGPGALVGCAPNDDVATWQAASYRPSKVINAWRQFAETYLQSFPNQDFVFETGPWGMPPVDEGGNIGRRPDRELSPSIIKIGKQVLGNRFILQNDGLAANWVWPGLQELGGPGPVALQMVARASNDPRCRLNHFQQPCDAHEMLQAAVDRGIGAGAVYLEIFAPDLMNPQLQDIIANAHQRLAGAGGGSNPL